MSGELVRLGRKTVFEGKVLNFCKDTVKLPDGKIEEWDFLHHIKGGGAAVVPVLPDGRIVMIRQMRPALNRWTLELPAGARDGAEDTAVTALRELREETGYEAKEAEFLMTLDTAPAWCDEKTDIYLARNIRKTGEQELDEAEAIHVEIFELPVLLEMIRRGEIRDSKTAAGITGYAALKLTNETIC